MSTQQQDQGQQKSNSWTPVGPTHIQSIKLQPI